MTNTTNPPAQTFSHQGVEVSVWRSTREKGPRYNVAARRSYRVGESWKTSTYFGERDIETVSHLLLQARNWIKADMEATPDAA